MVERSMKWFSITKFRYFSFQFNLHFWKKKYIVVYIIEKTLSLNFKFFHLNKISIRYQISKMMFCEMFKSNKVNRMHITILSLKVGWLGGKGVDVHPWDSRIDSHK